MPPEWFERRKAAIFAALLLVIIGLEIAQLVSGSGREAVYTGTVPGATTTAAKVYVSGAVQQPGVYDFSPGDRVQQALELAGGALPEADLARLNLAALLADEQQVHVPGRQSDESGPSKIDLNQAGLDELQSLPGIGEVTADKLIGYRRLHGPIRTLDDLIAAGLTRSQVEKIKDLVLFR